MVQGQMMLRTFLRSGNRTCDVLPAAALSIPTRNGTPATLGISDMHSGMGQQLVAFLHPIFLSCFVTSTIDQAYVGCASSSIKLKCSQEQSMTGKQVSFLDHLTLYTLQEELRPDLKHCKTTSPCMWMRSSNH